MMIRLTIKNSPDTRTDEEILDEINECSSSLDYLNHRTIQEDLCEIQRRLPKHGHWIGCGYNGEGGFIDETIKDYMEHGGDPQNWNIQAEYCSCCLSQFQWDDFGQLFDGNSDFCPKCGAKMDEGVSNMERPSETK